MVFTVVGSRACELTCLGAAGTSITGMFAERDWQIRRKSISMNFYTLMKS